MEYEANGAAGGWKARRRRKRRRALLIWGLLFSALLGTFLIVYKVRSRHAMLSKNDRSGSSLSGGSLYPNPPGIILHASESPAVVNGVVINAARLEQIHAHDHPNWATVFEGKTYHIGYHYVILPDGTIEQGRPDHCKGCHAPKHNDWLGICVVGQFDPSVHRNWWPSTPTAAQVASILSLCERLMSEYHIPPENVLRHRDVKETWCPGRRFPYTEIVQQLQTYAATHPETRPTAPAVITSAPTLLHGAANRQ